MTTVTLDESYRYFVGSNGPINPEDRDSGWWISDSDTSITLDPGVLIQVRSVETNLYTSFSFTVAPALTNLGILVQLCEAFDTDDRYYFSLINTTPQTIVLNAGDPIATIYG